MTRRKVNKVNTKLLLDVILASIIVQKAPAFINKFVPLNPTISQFAGVGAGYIAGHLAKRPDISNASIALAVTDFINPIIDSITGTVTTGGANLIQGVPRGIKTIANTKIDKHIDISDYVNLNDYIGNPDRVQNVDQYHNSY